MYCVLVLWDLLSMTALKRNNAITACCKKVEFMCFLYCYTTEQVKRSKLHLSGTCRGDEIASSFYLGRMSDPSTDKNVCSGKQANLESVKSCFLVSTILTAKASGVI